MAEKFTKQDLVIFLLQGGAGLRPCRVSTVELAEELDVSQQTASRWLSELAEEGMAERTHAGIRLTPRGMARCRALFAALKAVFEGRKRMSLEGFVSKGVGDGKYYLSMPEYKRQVREKLGFTPFPGTLNLSLAEHGKKAALLESRGIELEGFFKAGRMRGAAKCFRCVVNRKERGAVIIPMRSHYGTDVIEVIAPVSLRKRLGLKNGSRVSVDVELGAA